MGLCGTDDADGGWSRGHRIVVNVDRGGLRFLIVFPPVDYTRRSESILPLYPLVNQLTPMFPTVAQTWL